MSELQRACAGCVTQRGAECLGAPQPPHSHAPGLSMRWSYVGCLLRQKSTTSTALSAASPAIAPQGAAVMAQVLYVQQAGESYANARRCVVRCKRSASTSIAVTGASRAQRPRSGQASGHARPRAACTQQYHLYIACEDTAKNTLNKRLCTAG